MEDDGILVTEIEQGLSIGEHEVVLPGALVGEGGTSAILVVRRVDDNAGEEPVSVEVDAEMSYASDTPSVVVLMADTLTRARKVTLRIWASSRQRVRILWARLKKGAKSLGRHMSCHTCKNTVETLMVGALAAIGVGLAGGVVTLTAAQAAALPTALTGPLAALAAKLGAFWTAIQSTINAVNFVVDLKGTFFTLVCRRLGFCAQATPAPTTP